MNKTTYKDVVQLMKKPSKDSFLDEMRSCAKYVHHTFTYYQMNETYFYFLSVKVSKTGVLFPSKIFLF